MPRSTPKLPAPKPDRLHYEVDADGALVVRRAYGSGAVILDWNREPEMSPLLKRRRHDAESISARKEMPDA